MTLVISTITVLLLIAFVFRKSLLGKHPLSGVSVKLCQQSADSTVVATGLTDQNGNVEFKDLPTDSPYFVQFEGMEKGLNRQKSSLIIEGILLKRGQTKAGNPQTKSITHIVTKRSVSTEATVMYHDDCIKASIVG
jgi:hypothetical protein